MSRRTQVEAFGLLLGSPPPPDIVRPPATCAVVEGTLALAPSLVGRLDEFLADQGVPSRAFIGQSPAPQLVLRREVRSDIAQFLELQSWVVCLGLRLR